MNGPCIHRNSRWAWKVSKRCTLRWWGYLSVYNVFSFDQSLVGVLAKRKSSRSKWSFLHTLSLHLAMPKDFW